MLCLAPLLVTLPALLLLTGVGDRRCERASGIVVDIAYDLFAMTCVWRALYAACVNRR